MSGFEIDRDIPPPREYRSKGGRRSRKYPWAELGEGDSFVAAADSTDTKTIRKLQSSLLVSGKKWYQRNDPRFTVMTTAVDGGVRVWKIRRPESEET